MKINKVMIYGEISGRKLHPVYFELLSKAKKTFEDPETRFAAVILGHDLNTLIPEIKNTGIDEVYVMDDPMLKVYHPDYYGTALLHAIAAFSPDVLLMGATSMGEELAPALGISLRTGVAAHCIDFKMNENGELAQMVPAFGGKVIGEIFTPLVKPKIASIKPGMFAAEPQKEKPCSAHMLEKQILSGMPSQIRVLTTNEKECKRKELEDAEVIICGGYGIGSRDDWSRLESLAERLNGAVACTRPVLDAGWMESETNMVGTSGKSIRPKVYIGVGISGATHHICGMKDSGMIININMDPQAESFLVSDYTVTGDGNEIVKALLEAI